MPLPTNVHIDKFLTNVLIGLAEPGYIADQVLPPIGVAELTGKIAKLGENHLMVDFAPRSKGSRGNQVEFDYSNVPFALEEFRLEHAIDDVWDLPNYDTPLDARRDASMVVKAKLQRKKELLVASMVMNAANYAAGHTDATNRSWNLPATGTPVTDVQAAIAKIQDDTGAEEENIYAVCSSKVFRWLRMNNEVKAFWTSTTPGAAAPGALSKQQVAQALGVREIYVGGGIYNTAKRGGTPVKTYMWGADDFALFYKTPNPGIMSANYGYQIFPKIPGLPGAQVLIDRYRDEGATSEMVRGRLMLDQVVGENQYGFLFTSVDNA